MSEPIFIVFDGLDGAGKTTHAKALANILPRARPVLLTCEPSKGPEGRLIREILEKRVPAPSWRTMGLLFAADRQRHCDEEIFPALERGEIVICDRYLPSNLAYQTAGAVAEGRNSRFATTRTIEWIHKINEAAAIPSLTLFMNASIETVMARLSARTGSPTLYEKRPMLEQVQALMLSYVKGSLDDMMFRTHVVSTEDFKGDVEKRVLRAVAQHHPELELELRALGLVE